MRTLFALILILSITASAQSPTNATKSDNKPSTTVTHRIAIETTADGNLRYRSWHLPRPTTSTPDLTILGGNQTFEGTGLCAEPIYIFKNGDTTYKLSGRLDCTPDAPELATGDIEITNSRFPADRTHAWCF